MNDDGLIPIEDDFRVVFPVKILRYGLEGLRRGFSTEDAVSGRLFQLMDDGKIPSTRREENSS